MLIDKYFQYTTMQCSHVPLLFWHISLKFSLKVPDVMPLESKYRTTVVWVLSDCQLKHLQAFCCGSLNKKLGVDPVTLSETQRFVLQTVCSVNILLFVKVFFFYQAWHRNIQRKISIAEVGDTACHLCSSYCFNLLLAGSLSTSSKVQLNLSADGWKGFNSKEQRHKKKSIRRLDGSLSADKLKVRIAVGLESRGWWQLSTRGVLKKRKKKYQGFLLGA